jgi:hypothetical protein
MSARCDVCGQEADDITVNVVDNVPSHYCPECWRKRKLADKGDAFDIEHLPEAHRA